MTVPQRTCTAPGCDRNAVAHGICLMHYKRIWRGHGIEGLTVEERFFRHISHEDANGCWIWDKPNLGRGYGQFFGGAHRWSYEFFVGEIPEGLHLDHLCRNRACVNPCHLDPVPRRINILRGTSQSAINARKTHCVRGHPFDSGNTYVTPDGRRQCRTCRNRGGTSQPPVATGPGLRAVR